MGIKFIFKYGNIFFVMGVKISKILPSPKIIEMEDLKRKRVGIDAFNALYQFLASIQQNGEPLKDFQGNVTSHLSGIFYRNMKLLEEGIRPIYVFDGKPNALKQNEIDRRKELKKENLKKAQEAYDDGFDEDASKFFSRTIKVTQEMVEESKKLLHAMGIPYVESPEDAEAQSAWMCKENHIYASGTQDYDSLLFGSPLTIRNLTLSKTQHVFGKTIIREIELVTLPNVLQTLELTQNQLIDLAILVGTDFIEGVKNVGEKSALKYIAKYKSIEEIVRNKIAVRGNNIELDMELVQQVRDLFQNPRHTEEFTLQWRKPDEEEVKKILCDAHNFQAVRIENAIKKLNRPKASEGQQSLDKFF
jgi:flap endonuclease-1